MFIMFVILTFLVFFPFLTENLQLKHVMCVLIMFIFESKSINAFSSHDWPDDDSIKILSGVRKAMAPHSRVLVRKSHSNFVCTTSEKGSILLHPDEYIIQPANRVAEEKAPVKQAPEPLLPNYGAGRIRQYNGDIHMMAMLNSAERRLPQFIGLGDASGLEFVKLWDLGEMSLVEYKLPKAPQSRL